MHKGNSVSLILLALSLAGTTATAADPAPILNNIPPLLLQRGQTLDVTLDGNFLATVNSLGLSHARGVQASVIEPPKDAKPDNAHIRLHLSVDADAVLGTRQLRLISPTGVSAPVSISVGQYPQFAEKEPNNTPEQAQDVAMPATLFGKVEPAGDIDCFRFTATKGQKIVFDLHAVREGSKLDPLIAVYNDAGHELPVTVDLHGGDPVGVLDVPQDGRYVLSIRDLQYRGGGDFTYRIDAGAIPYVQSILPMAAQPGKLTEITPLGINLNGGTIPLDLTYAAEGREISVRAHASAGMSNPMPVELNELPVFADQKPGHNAAAANAVSFPVDISGRLEAGGEDCWFKFHVAKRQTVTIEAITAKIGSPLTPLLSLRGADGNVIQTIDDPAAQGMRITRDLDPADYLISIRDLFFGGGPSYAYRLQVRPGGAWAAGEKDFAVRFLPDAVRLSRGGQTAIFVDLKRIGEFKGEVTAALEGLPTGLTCPPIVINEKLPGESAMLVLSAAPDAPVGSFPIRLRASAIVGNGLISHEATPLLSGQKVDEAYVTVTEPAGFSIEPAGAISPQRMQQLSAEAEALAVKLASPNPQLVAAQAEWEKKFADPLVWKPLADPVVRSAAGTAFDELPDDSILARENRPEADTYTVTANTDLAGITAVRLEAIPDPSLPNNGPGRADAGNFVLTHFIATIASGREPAKAAPITFHNPVADFEQSNFPVIDAIEPKPAKGWATYPRVGTYNQAVFFTTQPVGTADGSALTFTLEQNYKMLHTLGRFRLSITNDPQAQFKASVPAAIAAILSTPADKRLPEDKARVEAYYKSIDPQVSQDISRLEAIRNLIGKQVEVARLEAALNAATPQLQAEQAAWEKSVEAGDAWLPLVFTEMKSQAGATLTLDSDDSIFVSGIDPAADTYTLTVTTKLKDISAIRIEALPDLRLPAGGPGRQPQGNFVLSNLKVFALPPGVAEGKPVEFRAAKATFEQKDYPAANALVEKPDAGWAVMPNAGKPSVATFYASQPFAAGPESTIKIMLGQQFSAGHHTLGRFRILVTTSANPDAATVLPAEILGDLKVAADKRNEKQKAEIAEFYRSIAPSLQPLRQRLVELKSDVDAQVAVIRGRKFAVPFLLNRAGFAGDVRVTLEGFTPNRDPNSGVPSLGGVLRVEPITLNAAKPGGTLELQVEGNSGVGPRYCVLRAEGKVGDDTRVEYSPPFVLTVLEK